MVPWYARLWTHSLEVWINGVKVRAGDLGRHVSFRQLLPSRDRESPLVLDLCLGNLHSLTTAPPDDGPGENRGLEIRVEALFTKVRSTVPVMYAHLCPQCP